MGTVQIYAQYYLFEDKKPECTYPEEKQNTSYYKSLVFHSYLVIELATAKAMIYAQYQWRKKQSART